MQDLGVATYKSKKDVIMNFHELCCTNIGMYFAHKKALDGATVSFKTGSIHALLGENGAGKSTLAHIISGFMEQTFGTVTLDGNLFEFGKKRNLSQHIAMVHQRPKLAEDFTVWQNALISVQKDSIKPYNKTKIIEKLELICSDWAINIDVSKKIHTLNDSERFYAALLCALIKKPLFLILDEPTAVLDAEQRLIFSRSLKKAKENTLGIIYISHNIEEVIQLCDTISVLKKGIFAKTFDNSKDDVSIDDILSTMFNPVENLSHEAKLSTTKPSSIDNISKKVEKSNIQKIILSVKNLRTFSNEKEMLKNISFDCAAGTITVIRGEKKSGLEVIERVLTGIKIPYFEGIVEISGKRLKKISPAVLRSNKVGIVSSNKYFVSSNPNLSVKEMLLPFIHNKGKNRREKDILDVKVLIESEKINISIYEPVSNLSGGMLQRLILSREMSLNPELLILAEPLHGLDTYTVQNLENKLRKSTENGTAVLILTTDADDGLSYWDCMYDIKNGNLIKKDKI